MERSISSFAALGFWKIVTSSGISYAFHTFFMVGAVVAVPVALTIAIIAVSVVSAVAFALAAAAMARRF